MCVMCSKEWANTLHDGNRGNREWVQTGRDGQSAEGRGTQRGSDRYVIGIWAVGLPKAYLQTRSKPVRFI